MKFSEQWLREWVNPAINTEKLAEQLTLAGLEVDSVEPVAKAFSHVVVGHVIEVKPHSDADRLRVCEVDIGGQELLSIVCGASNVRAHLKVAVAKINAILPGDFKIKKSKIRGVESHGMICSEKELGLSESSEGIMELPDTAPTGANIRDYLTLDDAIIDIDLTPNRGDCLSILGIAREVGAINKLDIKPAKSVLFQSTLNETIPVDIQTSTACPHYVGRIIRNINISAKTPLWMQERLQRSGLRPISPIVDITNYVLFELGQPLHAFDLDPVKKGITVRYAKDKESINLLDDQTIKLTTSDLIITSDDKPVALAGIKGGSYSGVSSQTVNIFLESALFNSEIIAKTSRQYGLFTDSSQRFERGIDYKLQRLALDRASSLIKEITGGELGTVIEVGAPYPEKISILLRQERISRILGLSLSDLDVEDILKRLGMTLSKEGTNWQVTPPSYRSDLISEIDLIEELARLYGYDNIPVTPIEASLGFLPTPEKKLSLETIKQLLVDRGYQEAITYSFVDPNYEKTLALQPTPLQLLNPISSDLAVLRTNHWPGLIKAYQYNYHRQQPRVRMFESGLCFVNSPKELRQCLRVGGLVAGSLYKEQWGESKRNVDFYDIKADIENLLALTGHNLYHFEPYDHPALHPGKAAGIFNGSQFIGSFGALHPRIAQEFDINQSLYLFDLDLESIMNISLPSYEAISKFPAIRRDIALVVATNVPAARIKEKILDSGGELLKNVQIFDVYQGKGIEPGQKSIALSLFFQHVSRTLVDTEINDFMQKIIDSLHKEFSATLRD